jgi:hypothetical protein
LPPHCAQWVAQAPPPLVDVGATDVVFELATLEAFVVVVLSVVRIIVLVVVDLLVPVAVEDGLEEPLLLRRN